MASSRTGLCRESAVDSTGWTSRALSRGGGIVRARHTAKADCEAAWDGRANGSRLAQTSNLSRSQKRRKRQSAFDAFAPFVLKRWQNGERNGLALWREMKAQGYTGTERSVYRYLETLKQAEVRASVNPARIRK